MRKVKKLIICICVVLSLSVNTGYEAYAGTDSAVLEVIGGSLAAGGIGAAMVAAAPVVAVIAAIALAAQGIYVVISDAAEAEGMTRSEFVESKLQDFAVSCGTSYYGLTTEISNGTQILSDGQIALSSQAADILTQFGRSLIAEDEIYVSSNNVSDVIFIDGKACPVIARNENIDCWMNSTGTHGIINASSTPLCVCIGNKSGRQIILVSQSANFYFKESYNGRESTSTKDYIGDRLSNGLYYMGYSDVPSGSTMYVPNIGSGVANKIKALNGWDVTSWPPTTDESHFESAEEVTDISFVPDSGNVMVLNPGLDLSGIASGLISDAIVSVREYLDTLQRALDGVENNTMAIQNTLTGVLDNVAVGTYNPVGTATAEQEDEQSIVGAISTPLVDTNTNPTGSEAEETLKGMQFDLTAIFPFCIPFDLYALIQKFDVTPEAPSMNIAIPLGGLGEDLEFDLDLAPWEGVAQVLRTMELIAFVVGLAMVTRQIIRG